MSRDFVLKKIDDLWFGIVPILENLGIKHAFTTRLHGKSIVNSDCLNLSLNVLDDKNFILQNRNRVCQSLKIDFNNLTTTKQVHKDNIIYVDKHLVGSGKGSYDEAIKDADALYTDLQNVPLMLLFADCVPIILCDIKKKIIAVVHSGWRGTVLSIANKTLIQMQKQFDVDFKDCYAVIGPSIGACCYQVGQDVYEDVSSNYTDYKRFLRIDVKDKQKYKFDLWQANYQSLIKAGIDEQNIILSKVCTQCNKELFFSHRADKGKSGRFAAIVWL